VCHVPGSVLVRKNLGERNTFCCNPQDMYRAPAEKQDLDPQDTNQTPKVAHCSKAHCERCNCERKSQQLHVCEQAPLLNSILPLENMKTPASIFSGYKGQPSACDAAASAAGAAACAWLPENGLAVAGATASVWDGRGTAAAAGGGAAAGASGCGVAPPASLPAGLAAGSCCCCCCGATAAPSAATPPPCRTEAVLAGALATLPLAWLLGRRRGILPRTSAAIAASSLTITLKAGRCDGRSHQQRSSSARYPGAGSPAASTCGATAHSKHLLQEMLGSCRTVSILPSNAGSQHKVITLCM